MTRVVSRSNTWCWLASVLGMLAGLWGLIVMVVFGVSQFQMIGLGTPLEIVLGIEGPAFLVLGLQGVGYATCGTIAFLAGIRKLHNARWLWLMFLLSLVFLGLSVIPFSTIGPIDLPAAVGLLISSLLLMASAGQPSLAGS
jgi:hypothetical protein